MAFDLDLNSALNKAASGISTLYNQISERYEPISIVAGTPQEGYPEGRTEVNTKSIIERAADVVTSSTSFYEQIKGLFGLGYETGEAQPVSPVVTETKPAPDKTTAVSTMAGRSDITILIVIGIVLFLFLK